MTSTTSRQRSRRVRPRVEFNIEGDPRPDLLALVKEVRPDQCTLVPVVPGEVTSQAGWTAGDCRGDLPAVVRELKALGIRVSLFVDPTEEAIRLAASAGADRVELYTEPFARAFERGRAAAASAFGEYERASQLAHQAGLGVNAGHDLDLDNLSCSARCRIWMRSRSATPSSRGRSSWASIASFASTASGDALGQAREPGALARWMIEAFGMKSEAVAFGVAGILFGLIAGWIIGSQYEAARRQPLIASPPPPPRRPLPPRRRPRRSTKPR